jgi:uncharacterized NAD(P)/FAD-binding protein YdhS
MQVSRELAQRILSTPICYTWRGMEPSARPSGSPNCHDVVVIGGGFSGVMTVVQLLRQRPASSIALIERGGRLGRGLAFGTETVQHLLNVPVGNMSASPDEPDSFHSWLRKNKHKDSRVSDEDFVSRQWYGEYVESLLSDQLTKSCSRCFRSVTREVMSIAVEGEGCRLELSDSSHLRARIVVLAVGNFPPSDPVPFAQITSPRYARYAWAPDALDGLEAYDSVLLIGSGLTAVDQVVTLIGPGRAFKGTIHMLSRRGLVPAMHAPPAVWPMDWTYDLPSSTRLLLRQIREQARLAAADGCDWRPVIDSLRPATQRIWKSLDLVEKRRFLRHVRSFWEVHRHRVAPGIGRLLEDLRSSGRLVLRAGRVLSCVDRDEYAEVTYRERSTGKIGALRVARIINCTGHETDARKIDSPLITSLLENGRARIEPSHLGLDVADDGALIDSAGKPSACLFALGSARKGLLWESTAVPEIRLQAKCLAERLVRELDGSDRRRE